MTEHHCRHCCNSKRGHPSPSSCRSHHRPYRNNDYICFICKDKTAEPVNAGCNHEQYKYPHPDWSHASCLRQWTRISNTCPICRAPCAEPTVFRVPSLLAW